eukprot:11000506-Alexandrium_andersonii.AAC.1
MLEEIPRAPSGTASEDTRGAFRNSSSPTPEHPRRGRAENTLEHLGDIPDGVQELPSVLAGSPQQ